MLLGGSSAGGMRSSGSQSGIRTRPPLILVALAAGLGMLLGRAASGRRRRASRIIMRAGTVAAVRLASCRPGFIRIKFVRRSLLMRSLAALAGYFPLLVFIHGSKTTTAMPTVLFIV